MNAPVNEQVKAEAAKSLLERMAEKTKLVRFFRYNASAKHGVPIDDEKDINITPEERKESAQQEPVAAQNIVQIVKTDDDDRARIAELERQLQAERARQSQQPTPTTGDGHKESSQLSDKVKGILQTLAVIGGLGAATYAGSQLGKSDEAPKDQQKVQAPYYSPYQYLEDNGEHLP